MTVDERVRNALIGFGDPVENEIYQGKAERYYTFNYMSFGADFADDAPQHERYLVQVHFFAPLGENISARKKATKQALFAAGSTWPEVQSLTNENARHVVFECEIAGGVMLDGDA